MICDVDDRRTTVLGLIRLLAQGAGINGMVGGQMLDLMAEQRPIGLEELETIHAAKTGALLRCACEAGAAIAGGREEQVRSLRDYGRWLGLAFQIRDDLLDVVGNTEQLGKAVGSDERKDKATYPKFLGLDGAKQAAGEAVDKALACLEIFPEPQADPLRAIARFVLDRTH